MSTQTETLHAGGFIINDEEGGGFYTREVRKLTSGLSFPAGKVVMLTAGKLVAWDAGTSSPIHGILYDAVDASAADKDATFIARGPCVVRLADLTYPAGTTTLVVNSLLAIGIVCR